MIEQVISREDYIESIRSELVKLTAEAKAEYSAELSNLSALFADQYYKYLNATTESDRKRAETNIRHIKASLIHISARMGLNVTERLITICSTAFTIAAAAAIRAII